MKKKPTGQSPRPLDFEAWFKAQFGKLPLYGEARAKLFRAREAAQESLCIATRGIECDELLHAKWQAARYAFNLPPFEEPK